MHITIVSTANNNIQKYNILFYSFNDFLCTLNKTRNLNIFKYPVTEVIYVIWNNRTKIET